MAQKVTQGRIVIYHENGDIRYSLPNGMQTAPAIVTQVFKSESNAAFINCSAFLANPGGNPILQCFSVRPEEEKIPGVAYWAWPPRV